MDDRFSFSGMGKFKGFLLCMTYSMHPIMQGCSLRGSQDNHWSIFLKGQKKRLKNRVREITQCGGGDVVEHKLWTERRPVEPAGNVRDARTHTDEI